MGPAGQPAAPLGKLGRWRAYGCWQWPALLLIAAVAAVADAWNMTSDGLEVYYAASVRSMAGNWHAFLYDSFDPSRVITLDKLPGPFWVQALSVRAFGLSVWAMVLPQVVWSVLTVVVLFVAVRRTAGPVTGLAAAAVLAISPVTILSAHGNLGDPLFVLLSVLAADAALRAVQGRGWWLVLAAVWVGLAFQEKMTEAWLLAVVLAAVYLLAGPAGLRHRLVRLAVAAPVLAVVSLAWLVFMTLTPAHDRPYADGSADNSVFAQVFSYNGIARFGVHPAYGLGYLARPSAAAVAYSRETRALLVSAGSQTRPGWDRLLSAPLAQVTGWFLVPALIVAVGCVVAVIRARRRQETRREYAPVLLWGLWLVTCTVVFSVSDDVQSYYFGILSPAIAALCALGGKAALDRFGVLPWRLGFAIGVTGAALWSAVVLFEAGPTWHGAAFGAGAAALVTGAIAVGLTATGRHRQRTRLALVRISLALTVAAGLAGPVIADGWLLAHRAGPFDVPLAQGGTFAQSSPSIVAARLAHPGYGGTILPQTSAVTWRHFQTLGREYDQGIPPGKWLAVYTSAAASNYVLAGVQRVLPIGGFTGSAPTPTVGQLTEMLTRHRIALAIIPGPGDVRYNDPRVQAIAKHCVQVSGFGDTTAKAQSYDCQDA